jgi:hypothetical protein
MSHRFDTTQAKQDLRLNCCDLYLLRGRPGATVMAMTCDADAASRRLTPSIQKGYTRSASTRAVTPGKK